MGPKALQFIHSVARKLLVPKGKGITSIANRMQAEAKASEIAETFRASGLTPDKWDDFLKSEKDVLKYFNIIEEQTLAKNVKTALTPKKSGEVLDLTGKKIDTSKPILGGKNVPEVTDVITETVTKIKTMEPVAAMKEANSVIGRKGIYKI